MKITFKVTPCKFTGTSKNEALNNMREALRLRYDEDANAVVSDLSGDLVHFNAHKLNRKVTQEATPTGSKIFNGRAVSFKRTTDVVREAQWVIQAYIIPKAVVDYHGVSFVQHANHFDIVREK